MIPPNFLGLPILPYFDLVIIIFGVFIILEVLLANRESTASIGILENVLALGDVLVALELPKDGPAIVAATREKSANVVPPDTVDRLLVIGQLRQFSHRLDFILVEKSLHCFDIALEVAVELDAGLIGPIILRAVHLKNSANQSFIPFN